MRVKLEQFLFGGTLYSWASVGQNIGRSLIKMGHDVEFISTDGIKDKYTPTDLKDYIKLKPSGVYDMQISYTAMHNFPHYLKHGNKNRFGIWNYDAEFPPQQMIKFHNFCDFFCPSSAFSAENFITAGVPKDKTYVIPHGINELDYLNKDKFKLKTKKKYKLLWDIATPHLRKNIANTLKIIGKAFTKKDDVCIVIKARLKPGQGKHSFVDIKSALTKAKKARHDYPEVELLTEFIPDMIPLYNACDIILMLSNFECFGLPALQGIFANKLVISSRYGGQLEFLNDGNSILVDCDLIRMPRKYQYWSPNPLSQMGNPKIEDGVVKLRLAVKNYEEIMLAKQEGINTIQYEYTWDRITDKIIGMCE